MNGFTKCKHCLRTVKVTRGLINRHVSGHWESTCKGFTTLADWVDTHSLNAHGRNSQGFCMACDGHISDGPNPDCRQCCYEKRNEND